MACSLPQNEDKLLDYHQFPPTPEINSVLQSHQMLLGQLITSPKKVQESQSPALAYLRAGQTISGNPLEATQLKNNLVIFTGDLSLLDQARIHHWIDHTLKPFTQNKDKWLQRVPVAHAITLVILHRHLKPSAGHNGSSVTPETLEQAWKLQYTLNCPPEALDIDHEAISLLECHMFETSNAAGRAGYQQQGLD